MGEIAEAMINGDFCEGCGMVLSGEGMGFPRYCSKECADDRGADHALVTGDGEYDD